MASCIKTRSSSSTHAHCDESDEHSQSLHHLWFKQGHVYFRFDISAIAPAPDEDWYFATITHQEIVGQYPYVRWAIGD